MSEYLHAEIDLREVARLEHQAAFFADFILHDCDLQAGQYVLDLASGVGAMTAQLADGFPGIRLFGVDAQLPSLRVAQANHSIAAYTQADGFHLPFRDESFDFVHCSWLLLHVHSRLKILHEVYRVLKVGGRCQFTEVDHSSLRIIPEYPEVVEVMNALTQWHIDNGGDPYIGRRLGELFQTAGFAEVSARRIGLRGNESESYVLRGFAEVLANVFDSAGDSLGPDVVPKVRIAAAKLRGLQSVEGGAIFYSPVVGRGTRER